MKARVALFLWLAACGAPAARVASPTTDTPARLASAEPQPPRPLVEELNFVTQVSPLQVPERFECSEPFTWCAHVPLPRPASGLGACYAVMALHLKRDVCPALATQVQGAAETLTAASAYQLDGQCRATLATLRARAATLGCKIE